MAATVLSFSSFYSLLATLPLYVYNLGGGDLELGLIMGLFSLGAIVPRPFVGRYVDARGSKLVIVAGTIVFTLSALLYSWAGSIPLLLALRLFHGVGIAFWTTGAIALAADLAPAERRGEAMGLWSISLTLAMAVAPWLGWQAMSLTGFLGLFILAAAAAAGSFVLALLLPTVPPRTVHPSGGPLLELEVWPAALGAVALTVTYGAVVSFVSVFAKARGIADPSLFFTAYALTLMLSRWQAGKLADKLGRWACIIPGMAIVASGLLLLPYLSGLPVLIASGILYGLGYGLVHPALMALAVDLSPPGRQGAGVATFTSSFELGIVLGSVAMGWVAQVYSYGLMWVVAGLVPLLSIALLLATVRR
jgi:MFS family permease